MSGAPSYADALQAFHAGDSGRCHAITGDLLAGAMNGPALLLRAVSTPQPEIAKAGALNLAACRQTPFDPDCWFNLGVWLEARGRQREAAQAYRRALAIDPGHRGALLNGTQALRVCEYFAEALPHARRLQTLEPINSAGYAHEAICLAHLGQLDEADGVFAKAVARASDPSLLHWEHHFSLLARGRFAEAWDKYETRFACAAANGVDDMAFDLPRWSGDRGQHVLVYGEQGLGDTLMFASALGDLARVAKQVSLVVAPPLASLFAASFPTVQVMETHAGGDPAVCAKLVARAGQSLPVDAVLPIGSLMQLFRRSRDRFDGRPCLRPSRDAELFWASSDTDAARGRRPFRVGLCWACNPGGGRFFSVRRALHRTMPIDALAPLVEHRDVEAIALTNVPLSPDAAAALPKLRDVSASLVDLDRTAALIASLDLVITVDTAVAHLAGALGKPVWVLLHKAGDPRWGLHGTETSYWYRSMRLFWQNEPGNWPELVARVCSDFGALVTAPRRRSRA